MQLWLLIPLMIGLSGCGQGQVNSIRDKLCRMVIPSSNQVPGTYIANNGSILGVLILRPDHTFVEFATRGEQTLLLQGKWSVAEVDNVLRIRRSDRINERCESLRAIGGDCDAPVMLSPLPFSKTHIAWNEDLGLVYVQQ